MKNFLPILCLLTVILLNSPLYAHTVIIKGYVKDSANKAVANRTVKIYSTDSSNRSCIISHTKITNPNGYYIDTLTCELDIRKISIVVENCDGTKIIKEHTPTSSGIIESNFIICTPFNYQPGIALCKAAFSYISKPDGVKFNGAGTFIPNGDSLLSFTWNFGDSSTLVSGKESDLFHQYKKPGIYTVCLTIKTKKGCESRYCTAVIFTPVSNDCNVKAAFSVEKIGNKLYRFNSNQSSTLAGDSIFQRIWKFSDGNSLDGNQINPYKQFKDTGKFSICLIVKTMKGCVKEFCFNLEVKDSIPVITPNPPVCKAYFEVSKDGLHVKFNSKESKTSSEDSIISRTWLFGDSSESLKGNRIDPSYQYRKAGTYNACLYIKTKAGCESKYCFTIKLYDSIIAPKNCKAYFTTTLKDSLVIFNSADAKGSSESDSIISRTWYYVDSLQTATLNGNIISPSYPYTKPGVYTVYLVIKTKNGCENKFAGKVVIPNKPVPDNCKASFTYTIKDSLIVFNSTGSKGVNASDSIISRIWQYADSTTSVSLSGNIIMPSYQYTKPGTYKVSLIIKTKAGCENKFSGNVVVQSKPRPTNCKAQFSFSIQNKTVKFNSTGSSASSIQDSIISRIWIWGDNTSIGSTLSGNQIDPVHTFTKAGTYMVYLYIKTKEGCESKYEAKVVIAASDCKVEVGIKSERISLKKVQFNSQLSSTLSGDSIVQRIWHFGDNTSLKGNVVNPIKEFPLLGIYNTCLEIKTANGCEAKSCIKTVVQDTMNNSQANKDYVKILSINPNPVISRMMATIYSRNNQVESEISIYYIYGTNKLTIKKVLSQGNNIIEISALSLPRGPFFLKVTTKYGRDSKAFYKL